MTDQTQAREGPRIGISVDHGKGQVGHHARRAKPLTSAEKACLDAGKEHRVLENDRIHGPSFMLRIIIGKLWHFKRQVCSYTLTVIIFPRLNCFFPYVSLLACDFLTFWWINFVFLFINVLFPFPWVKFCLCFSMLCSVPHLRKINFIPSENHNYF